MKLLLVGAVVCGILFLVGVLYPSWSRRLQSILRRFSKKGEARSDSSGGRIGDLTRDGLKRVRRASDKSARAGRKANRKVRNIFR